MNINHDLESTPLKIKTNIDILNGEQESIRVLFYDSSTNLAGHVIIDIRLTTFLMVKYCETTWEEFTWDTDVTKVIKECTITKESAPSIKIECNGELLRHLVMSDSTCDNSNWRLIWNKDVTYINFSMSDKASDFYFGMTAGENNYIAVRDFIVYQNIKLKIKKDKLLCFNYNRVSCLF